MAARVSWSEAIGRWCTWMRSGGSPTTTISLRRYYLQRFARYAGGGPAGVGSGDVQGWLAAQEWSANTRKSALAALRGFFRWAVAQGLRKSDPTVGMPSVRVPRAQPRPVPESAYRAALAAAACPRLRLAGECGLRRGELARARVEDVEQVLLGYSIRVRGKGGHVRMVPLADDLAALLLDLGEGYVFVAGGRPVTAHHLGKLVGALLPEGYGVHSLRHRCATVAYAGTRDLRSVQELLGHASVATTQAYTAVPDESVRAAVLAAAA